MAKPRGLGVRPWGFEARRWAAPEREVANHVGWGRCRAHIGRAIAANALGKERPCEMDRAWTRTGSAPWRRAALQWKLGVGFGLRCAS